MANSNKSAKLHRAKERKRDEFYTRYEDIAAEAQHYWEEMRGKTIYCNCDTPQSNFVKYYTDNFKNIGLKKFIATGYRGEEARGTYYIYDGKTITQGELEGNGSYDSPELDKYYEECDIITTNPPFSKFGDYWNYIMSWGKEYLILGTIIQSHYQKSVFPYIINGWTTIGYTGGSMLFDTPYDDDEDIAYKEKI